MGTGTGLAGLREVMAGVVTRGVAPGLVTVVSHRGEEHVEGAVVAGPANGRGLGMIGMRARASSAGGGVTVRSRPGEGVLIEVRVPLRHETHAHPSG